MSLCFELRGVSKRYESSTGVIAALEGLDLDVECGSFVTLVGRSGSGKSTLLDILAGLTHANTGRVEFEGAAILGPSPSVGIMFQRPVLLPWLTVFENVALPGKLRRENPYAVREAVRESLQLTELEQFAHLYPGQLSGGMAQRAALSRLLAYRPKVLLLDEPFSALDEFTREGLNEQLLSIWRSTQSTVVFVTHSVTEAVYLSDQIVVMGRKPGRVLAQCLVDLPRPRLPEMMRSATYLQLVFEVRRIMGRI